MGHKVYKVGNKGSNGHNIAAMGWQMPAVGVEVSGTISANYTEITLSRAMTYTSGVHHYIV